MKQSIKSRLKVWVAKNLMDLQGYIINNPVETIMKLNAVSPTPVQNLELIAAYYKLSVSQGKELARYALNLKDIEAATKVLRPLSMFLPKSLEGLYDIFVELGLFEFHCELFRGADAEARDKLINLLDDNNFLSKAIMTNRILEALAWIGDEVVIQKFQEWTTDSPQWRSDIYLEPIEFSDVAGWEITSDNKKRELFFRDAYTLLWDDNPQLPPSQDNCRWCQLPLVSLFDFDLTDKRLAFLGLYGTRLNISICSNCSYGNTIFTEIDTYGKSKWSAFNLKQNDMDNFDAWTKKGLVLGLPRKSPFETLSYLPIIGSQVGGFPSWVQDAAYPKCPNCQKTMVFIAQLTDDPAPYGDGTFFALICASCNLAATVYQCT